jgi:hypothetical protein
MDQGTKQLKIKRSLREQEIFDLFSDELSDMPCDTSSDSDPDSGSDSGQERLVATGSKSERSCDEDKGSNIVGTATWGKVDKTPTSGQFTGKGKHPSRQCGVCVAHKKRSKTVYICKF